MPVRPPPFTIRCTKCGWQTTVQLRSDAIHAWEMPSNCPRCGSTDLSARRGGASGLGGVFAAVGDLLRGKLK